MYIQHVCCISCVLCVVHGDGDILEDASAHDNKDEINVSARQHFIMLQYICL